MPIRPSIRLSALPRSLPLAARFAIAREAGFEGIEVEVGDGPAAALRDAADRAGLPIHSVHCWENYSKPLSSPDPATRDAGIAATLAALAAAHALGARSLRIIPGVAAAESSLGEVYARSRDAIRAAILPEAERLGIAITIENVCNGFLLSPSDCARYVGEFDSPLVRLCLDVGNIRFGGPESWIDIAGAHVGELHAKDVVHRIGRPDPYRLARVGEGQIDWACVRAALARVGFSGWAVMAEAEYAQPRLEYFAFMAARRLGANPAARQVETHFSRRIAEDSMRRFRTYVAPSGNGSAG
jgi:hexulose-6-phosphate isomerase